MSANLPLIFEHFKYENSFYIDGGIVNNFAIDTGEKYGKKVLGICLGVNNMNSPQDNPNGNILEYIYTLLLVPMVQSMKYKIKSKSETTTVVELRCSGNIKMFNFDINSKTKLEMFSLGYEDTKNVFNKQSPEPAHSVDASSKKEAASADPAP
jgi:predicted acylesterase/phospholipase RssA